MTLSFSEKVYSKLKLVPPGYIVTYASLAKAVGSIGGSRAGGNALNKNPNAPKVPCHRVVCSDGKVGGYAFGVNKKIEILKNEGITVVNGKVVGFEKKKWKFRQINLLK